MNNTLLAFVLTVIAGLATGIGSCIAFFAKSTNKTFLAVSLGFSAGVMIYVSTVEIFAKAKTALGGMYGDVKGGWITVAAFFGGMVLIALIDRLIPSPERLNKSAAPELIEKSGDGAERSMMRTGIMTALAIAIHNFPEGMATFVSALGSPNVAAPIVVAIAIHNIPEGIAVSAPIYRATGSRKKAFVFSFLSGLAEPIGALCAWLILMPVMNDAALGIVFGVVAGIMVFISVDDLLPAAREAEGGGSRVTYGAVVGMAVMAVSLMLFM